MKKSSIKNITLYDEQVTKIEELKDARVGFNFSGFVRDMMEKHLDKYVEELPRKNR